KGYVLDFFAGSGTTNHAIIELNQNENKELICLLIQLDELINSKVNLNHDFKTIDEITKLRIEKILDKNNLLEIHKNTK
ncbi:MAG: hypothetical protein ACRC4M_04765, partial [Mycoplasma sp.]